MTIADAPGSGRSERTQHVLSRIPVAMSGPAVTALSGLLYIATGVAVLVSTSVSSGSPGRDLAVVRGVNLFAIVAGVCMVVLRRRARGWIPHAVTFGGVVLITAALHSSGGGVSAVAYASVYCLAPGYAYLVLTPRAATVHLVAAVALGAPTLAQQPGVGVAEQVVVWSVAGLLSAVIGHMAHALREAETDALTGLLNRRGVERLLQASVTSRDPSTLTLALLDIDHFKAYNDDRGRAGGDRLLVQTAATWRALLPTGASLGRMGADEFALVVPTTTATAADELLAQLHAAVTGVVSCSAGVVQHEAGESVSMMVSRAEGAVYTAKRQGRGRTHRPSRGEQDGQELRDALGRGEFVVHYQPIVQLTDQRVAGAEALIRWQHPERGLVPPVEFLTAAERSGAILAIGDWVVRQACREAASWTAPVGGGPAPYVAVNASGQELQDPGYAERVAHALRESGLSADRLLIELVESYYDIESVQLAANLHKLAAMGVRTAMDDFGMGYSSVDRLRRSGVATLKIDRSFIADITCEDVEAPLVAAIIAMAKALKLRIVAEGVETVEQSRWLARHGCDYGQGWLFGRPAARLTVPTGGTTAPSPASLPRGISLVD